MTGVGAFMTRVLCGFPNPCGRVLGVHGDGSVHALRRRLALERARAGLAECRMSTTVVSTPSLQALSCCGQRERRPPWIAVSFGLSLKASCKIFVSLACRSGTQRA